MIKNLVAQARMATLRLLLVYAAMVMMLVTTGQQAAAATSRKIVLEAGTEGLCVMIFAGKRLSPNVIEGVLIFALLYVVTFALFALFYAAAGLDVETALSASITALANVGPGVGSTIGPSGTFQSLPDVVKWLLAFQMILGRLEIVSGIIILTPDFWQER